MRKFFVLFVAIFAIIGFAGAPAQAQEECNIPDELLSGLPMEVSVESLFTRQAPSVDAVLTANGRVLRGTIVNVISTVQIGCDLWVEGQDGWLGAYVNGAQNLSPIQATTVIQAQARALVPQALVNNVVAGAMPDGTGSVQVPQLDQEEFNLLVPEGGISFFAEEIQPGIWQVVAVIGATLIDDENDDGAVLPISGFDPSRSIATVIFRNDAGNQALIDGFVAELFELGATSVSIQTMNLVVDEGSTATTRNFSTAPRSTYSFEFANPSTQVFEAQLERSRPQGSGSWDDRSEDGSAGWNLNLQRLNTVIGASGFTNWFAGDRLNATLANGTELTFDSAGEKGEHIVFFSQSPLPITLSSFNQGTSSFTALVGGNETIDFTIQNVTNISFDSNCGDGCDFVFVTMVDTNTGVQVQERFTRRTLTEANILALIERFETARRQR